MKRMRIRAVEGCVASLAKMKMNNTTIRLLLAVLLLGASAACSWLVVLDLKSARWVL